MYDPTDPQRKNRFPLALQLAVIIPLAIATLICMGVLNSCARA